MFDLFGKKWRARAQEFQQEAETKKLARISNRDLLARKVVTSTGPFIAGRRIVEQLGVVFAKWHLQHPEQLPESLFLAPGGYNEFGVVPGDSLDLDALVMLCLRWKAQQMGANAIVRMRVRTFKNGCEGSGDAVIVDEGRS